MSSNVDLIRTVTSADLEIIDGGNGCADKYDGLEELACNIGMAWGDYLQGLWYGLTS